MSAWLKRFGLHLAAAVGATGIFVAAAAVGATQTRQQAAVSPPFVLPTRNTTPRPKPTVVAVTPTDTPAAAASSTSAAAAPSTPTDTAPSTPTDTAQPPNSAGEPVVAPTSAPTSAPVVTGPAAPVAGSTPALTGPAPSTPRRAATQTRPQAPPTPEPPTEQPADEPTSPSVRTDAQQAATPVRVPLKPQQGSAPAPTPTARPAAPEKVVPERSLAGTVKAVQPDSIDVLGVGGREWHVEPVAGALIRLNGKTVKLDALQVGDNVVILGQAQPGPGARFLAHAITAKSK